MHLLSSLLFSLSANIDNLTVGITYGMRKIRIGTVSNLLIAFVTSMGTLASISVDLLVAKLLTAKVSNSIGNLILVAIGIWIVKDYFGRLQSWERPSFCSPR